MSRARILRLRCECGRNIADVIAGDAESVELRHRARLLPAAPGTPSYAWTCRCGREHRVRRKRLVPIYLAVPAGSVEVRTFGPDL